LFENLNSAGFPIIFSNLAAKAADKILARFAKTSPENHWKRKSSGNKK
jgi:hypothetical protein